MSLIADKYRTELKSVRPNFGPPGLSYQVLGGGVVSMNNSPQGYITDGYDVNDTVYAIVNLILDKVRVAPWAVYKIIDESSLKLLQAVLSKKELSPKDYKTVLDLRTKAFELVKSPGRIGELLKYPNDYDTFQDFVANGCGYKLLTGNKVVWGDLLPGGANKGKPYKLWNGPSQYFRVLARAGFPAKVIGYDLPIYGLTGQRVFTPEEILHEKYMNYNWDINGSQLIGTSPLKAAARRLANSNSALEVATAKFKNGGMEAIIYADDSRFTIEQGGEQMKAIKAKLINGEYAGEEAAGKIATSGYKVGIAQLGYTPVQLDIIKAEMNNTRFLCNVFGVPSQLLNDPENKSFNNAKEGEKALTTRCALPLLTSTRDNLNRKFHSDWGMDKGWLIDFDMSVYSELSVDLGETVKWIEPLVKMTGLSPNAILDLMGQAKIDHPYYDQPRVTDQMGVSIEEHELNDVDKALQDD